MRWFLRNTTLFFVLLSIFDSVRGGVYSDIEESKGCEPTLCKWSGEFDAILKRCADSGFPALIFFCNQKCGNCSIAVKNTLDSTEFMNMINSYHDVYLGYSLSFSNVREIRNSIFQNATSSSYKGFPTPTSDGRHEVGLPSVVLINVVGGKTNMFFHIHGGNGYYDDTDNYVTCPYHDTIPIRVDQRFSNWNHKNIYVKQIQGMDGTDSRIEQTTTRFTDLVKEYLDTVVPHGSGIAKTYTDPETQQSTISTNVYYVNRKAIIARFEIVLSDIIKDRSLVLSDLTNQFNFVEMSGNWFIDRDEIISASQYGQNSTVDSASLLFAIPRKNGTFHIQANMNNAFQCCIYNDVTNITSFVSAYKEFDTGTEELINSQTETISNVNSCIVLTVTDEMNTLNVQTNDILAIRVTNQKITTFDIE